MSIQTESKLIRALASAGSIVRETVGRHVSYFRSERLGQAGLAMLVFIAFLGVFGSSLAPYDPGETMYDDDGPLILQPPSADHLLGTNNFGQDVLSRLVVSARVSVIVGISAALIAMVIGTIIGIVSGYFGGWIDDVLMRFTDIVNAMPFIPFIIVFVVILGRSLEAVIISIGLIQWRSTARIIRAEILSVKERPYVEAAKASGIGHVRLMARHLLPNVLPLVLLYSAFSIGWAVLAEASLAFLGFGDPQALSWGKMLFQVYNANAVGSAWWWMIPPGLMLSLFVVSAFMVSRVYEKRVNPSLDQP